MMQPRLDPPQSGPRHQQLFALIRQQPGPLKARGPSPDAVSDADAERFLGLAGRSFDQRSAEPQVQPGPTLIARITGRL